MFLKKNRDQVHWIPKKKKDQMPIAQELSKVEEPDVDTGPSVLQDWVVQLPMKMQSTLIVGLRGPDTARLPEVKKLSKWLRGIVFKPADPDNLIFMTAEQPARIEEKSQVAHELEFCSVHFFAHLMHTFQIVGYGHSNQKHRAAGQQAFEDMCKLLHVPPEDKKVLESRLGHKNWPGGKQPNDFAEAMSIMNPPEEIVHDEDKCKCDPCSRNRAKKQVAKGNTGLNYKGYDSYS